MSDIMSDIAKTVQNHYGRDGLMDRIISALKEAGVDPEKPRYQDFFPFDQLHGVGLTATRDHADRARLRPGMHVLDLGCGIGGSSRYLVAERQCRVTGIDLTPDYIEAARELTSRCGLSAGVEFRQADALALPFPDASFDHVWCHNVTMNIPDKKGLAAEVARVLKHGGRFSCVEVAQGPAGAPTFPVPWAMDASSSFLATPAEMHAALEASGLRIIEQLDITQFTLAYAKDVTERVARGEAPPFRHGVVMGDDFPPRVRNFSVALTERKLLDQFILAERP
jgi:ubiquinone/menaquinone biosynthesis C-methylase UbiE